MATTCHPPGTSRPASPQQPVEHEQHGGARAVADLVEHGVARGEVLLVEVERLAHDLDDLAAAGVHRPAVDVLHRDARAGRAAPRRRAGRAARARPAPPGDSPILKPRSVTSHVMWSAVETSVRATTSTTSKPGRVGLQHHGRGGVAEQRVRHHLLQVLGRRRAAARGLGGRLHVQARQLEAEHHGRLATGGDEVGGGGEAGQRGVAAHVADVQALHARRSCRGRGRAGRRGPGVA